MVNDIATSVEGQGFDFWAGQIGRRVAQESLPQLGFVGACFFYGKISVIVQIKFVKTEKINAISVN